MTLLAKKNSQTAKESSTKKNNQLNHSNWAWEHQEKFHKKGCSKILRIQIKMTFFSNA